MSEITVTLSRLPPFLAEIARLTDIETAVKLAEAWSGTKRAIPARPTLNSPIAAIVGLDAARKIGAEFGGIQWDIPRPSAPSLKEAILASKEGTRAVATRLGCSERYVRTVRNGGAAR